MIGALEAAVVGQCSGLGMFPAMGVSWPEGLKIILVIGVLEAAVVEQCSGELSSLLSAVPVPLAVSSPVPEQHPLKNGWGFLENERSFVADLVSFYR